jgi:hypothetical protein
MEITLENLHKFVAHYGEVSIVDSTGMTRKLKDGTPDVWELAAKADKFRFEGRWLSRAEMGKQLDRMKPANVSQVSLAGLEHMKTDPDGK